MEPEPNHRQNLINDLAEVLGKMVAETLQQLTANAAMAVLRGIDEGRLKITVEAQLPPLHAEFFVVGSDGEHRVKLFSIMDPQQRPITITPLPNDSDTVN